MDAWERAIAFMRTVDERAAESVVPFRWGRAVVNQRLNRVHDLNFLIADRRIRVRVPGDGRGRLASALLWPARLRPRRHRIEVSPNHRYLTVANGRLNEIADRFRHGKAKSRRVLQCVLWMSSMRRRVQCGRPKGSGRPTKRMGSRSSPRRRSPAAPAAGATKGSPMLVAPASARSLCPFAPSS